MVVFSFLQANNDDSEVVMKPGAIYLGHIPHGFYEKEMRGYFSQFGKVTRLRLFRSKKVERETDQLLD